MTSLRRWIAYLFFAAAAAAIFLASARSFGMHGFPLDDAWIHQVYARNWVRTGEWAFQPGEPSAGSTSPLWSALMAGGHLLGVDPVTWSAGVGVVTLAALATLGAGAIRRLVPDKPGRAFWVGLLLIGEWHLVWAALSGMETLLYAFVAAWVIVELAARRAKPFWIGLLVGVGLWLRPDALTLVVPVLLVLLVSSSGLRDGFVRLMGFGIGFLVLALPYLALNHALSGSIWPTTFFAKQAEYAALRGLPLAERLLGQFTAPLAGAALVLLPWLAVELRSAWARRNWGELAGGVWIVLMGALYALRLPVTYQHGRYMIPVIPVLLVLGAAGLARTARTGGPRFWPRVLGRTAVLLTGAAAIAFFALGLRAYVQDVAVIETEMAATARWIASNTEPGVVIAAHDIGALGFFGGRRIVDLAGLVSPEVVPILRDEAALAAWMDQEGVDLFVTLRGWYPQLETGLPVLFATGAPYSPALGGTNMVVYEWAR